MVFFIFVQILIVYKQTVKTLVRCRTVCLCPTKRTLGLYGLNHIAIVHFPTMVEIIKTIFNILSFHLRFENQNVSRIRIPYN